MPKPKTRTGLDQFAVPKQSGMEAITPSAPLDDTSVRHNAMTAPARKGDTVACTVRLPRAAWLKVQHLALDEGTSFQALAVAGLDEILRKRGLPGLTD